MPDTISLYKKVVRIRGNDFKIPNSKYLKSLFLVYFLMSSVTAAPDLDESIILVSKPINPYENLINAIVMVESSGNTFAFNCDEEAIGAFQIRPIRLQDYNQRTGKNYQEKDLYNFEISKEIFLYYASEIGYPDYEAIARHWNGSGKATFKYWEKVKSYL
jgi:hypothetical protein